MPTITNPVQKRRTIDTQRILAATGVNVDKTAATINEIPPIFRAPYRSANTPTNGVIIRDPQKKDPMTKLCS